MKIFISIAFIFGILLENVKSQSFLEIEKFTNQPEISGFECVHGLRNDVQFIKEAYELYEKNGIIGALPSLPFISNLVSNTQENVQKCLGSSEFILGLISLATREQRKCQEAMSKMKGNLKVLSEAVKEKNITLAMEHATETVESFFEALSKCTGKNSTQPKNLKPCITEAGYLLKDLQVFYESYKNGNLTFNQFLNSTKSLLSDFPKVISICQGSNSTSSLLPQYQQLLSLNLNNLQASTYNCTTALNEFIEDIKQLIQDLPTFSQPKLFTDISKISSVVTYIWEDCIKGGK